MFIMIIMLKVNNLCVTIMAIINSVIIKSSVLI